MSVRALRPAVLAGLTGLLAIAVAIGVALCIVLPWCGCTADRAVHREPAPRPAPR